MTRNTKRSIERWIEEVEESPAREGADAVSPEIRGVKEPIVEEYSHDAYMEVLTSVVLMLLPPNPLKETERERTPAGFPAPSPEVDNTAFDSVEERDEAIADLAEAWDVTDFDHDSQRRGRRDRSPTE